MSRARCPNYGDKRRLESRSSSTQRVFVFKQGMHEQECVVRHWKAVDERGVRPFRLKLNKRRDTVNSGNDLREPRRVLKQGMCAQNTQLVFGAFSKVVFCVQNT